MTEVLSLYREGWFPMNEQWEDTDKPEVRWVQPAHRGIIPLDPASFRISRSLRSRVRAERFQITADTAFAHVIRACARPARGRESTWLSDEIIHAFELLHRAGHAHSIEAWLVPGSTVPSHCVAPRGDALPDTPVLVGGLYGLAIGSVFCGESMFSRPDLGGTDASKVCLVHLVHHLRRRGFTLLDAQMTNEHLDQFGCQAMPREDYLTHVRDHASLNAAWLPFEPGKTVDELDTTA